MHGRRILGVAAMSSPSSRQETRPLGFAKKDARSDSRQSDTAFSHRDVQWTTSRRPFERTQPRPCLLGMGVRVGSDEALLARPPGRAAPLVFWYGRRGQHDMSHVRRDGNLLGHFDITGRTPTYRANTNSQRNRWEGRDSCRPHCKTRNVLDPGSSLCTQHQNQQDR